MFFWTFASSMIGALGGLIVYLYYLRKGQFDDSEIVKYQLFREEDPDN